MIYIGIDIAKAKFDASVSYEDSYKHKTFNNIDSGFKALLKWLSKFGTMNEFYVCMEATGNYSFPLATYLASKTVKVSIVNPAQVKSFARSELSRNKTDKLDAALIARFCKEKQPRLWSPPSPKEKEFKALYRRLDTVKQIRAQEKTRLSGEICEVVKTAIQASIASLDEQLEVLEAALDVIVREHPVLKHRCKLLKSIPGIGKTTAYLLLAELDFDLFNNINQLVAFAGLNPKQHTSGNFKGKSPIYCSSCSKIRFKRSYSTFNHLCRNA